MITVKSKSRLSWDTWTTILVLCCLISGGLGQWLTVTHIWDKVDFEYPTTYMRRLFLESKEHVPEDVVLLDVDEYKDRIFVTSPSLISGTPASLSTLIPRKDKPGFSLLRPFPDWAWHNITDPRDCQSIKSIFRIKIDKLGRLWAVDSGVGFAFSERKGRYNCNPKIMVFDLEDHDRLIRSYEIDKLDIDEDSLLLNIEVQILSKDGEETFAYIADSMGTRMIVYDFAKDEVHAYQHPYFFPDPSYGFYHVNDRKFTVMDGLFNIVVDEKTDTLYFHTLSSGSECSAPAALLRNKTMTEDQARTFTRSAPRPFHVSTEVITDNGLIIFPSLEDNALFVWDTKTPYTIDNFLLVAKDDEVIQFPTGMKIAGDKFIMLTARLQNMLVTGVPNRHEINYRILQGDVDVLKHLFNRHAYKIRRKPSHNHQPGGQLNKNRVEVATSYSYSRNTLHKPFRMSTHQEKPYRANKFFS
ncbi:melanin biosynthetic process [Nesidiocoris tenuis]|uniref:Melanin biosynthetic process n=1 Tax=Nesidiocoris tenuis TaxID=355587 RepID=A0ABN7B7Y4_9HEMI|nr:melanin biosynthetic process [Nesidiocoris tenuis]